MKSLYINGVPSYALIESAADIDYYVKNHKQDILAAADLEASCDVWLKDMREKLKTTKNKKEIGEIKMLIAKAEQAKKNMSLASALLERTENGAAERENIRKSRELIHRAKLDAYALVGKRYPGLPEELKSFYYYEEQNGHKLIFIQPGNFSKDDRDKHLMSAPVKTVLRTGYEVKGEYLVCPIPFDNVNGVHAPREEFEF